MKLYNIKKLYQGFKNAVGVEDEFTAKMLWDEMMRFNSGALTFSEHFEVWMRRSKTIRKMELAGYNKSA